MRNTQKSTVNLAAMQKCTLYFIALVLTFFILGPVNAQAKKTQACFYTRERAVADLKENTAKILVQGGLAPIIYDTDRMFFERYKIPYYIFGCVAPESVECLNDYNRAIFEYLDKTFGKSWRMEVRKDAIGFKR